MRSMLYWPINADDENFLGVLAGWAATLKRMRRHLGFWGCGSEPSLIKTDRCHASVPSNKTLSFFSFFFFLLSFGFILKNKWRTDTRIQLTLHCCLPVSRNIRTCLQRQDNPAGAPLHSPCQGLCVIMSSSLYIIQPITHHLPDDSNGKKIDWKRFFFFFFTRLDFSGHNLSDPCRFHEHWSVFLFCCVRFVELRSFRLLASLNRAAYKWCLSAEKWVKPSLFPALLKQPKTKTSLASDSISFTAEIFLYGWIRCSPVFPPDQCASPLKLFLFSVTSIFFF